MSTRSVIGVMHGSKAKTVYCHWDGYLSHNGKILLEHYNSSKANHLVAMGDISSLRPEIGEKHLFSIYDQVDEAGERMKEDHPDFMNREVFNEKFGDMTTFYGRDRGDTDTEFQVCMTDKEMYEMYPWCEFFYINQDGVWYVSEGEGTEWKVLSDAIAVEEGIMLNAPSVTRLIGMMEEA